MDLPQEAPHGDQLDHSTTKAILLLIISLLYFIIIIIIISIESITSRCPLMPVPLVVR